MKDHISRSEKVFGFAASQAFAYNAAIDLDARLGINWEDWGLDHNTIGQFRRVHVICPISPIIRSPFNMANTYERLLEPSKCWKALRSQEPLKFYQQSKKSWLATNEHLYREGFYRKALLENHTTIICDHCDLNIDGFYIHCLVCPDFDLCQSCWKPKLLEAK